MQVIPLDAVPNQSFSVLVDDHLYDMRLVTVGTGLAVDITRDNVRLLSGTRVLPGELWIPYRYQEAGNFIMLTDDDQIPTYEALGTLVYMSDDELAVIRDAA